MDEIDSDYTAMTSLRAIFEGARDLGLDGDEVWRAIDASLCEVGGDGTVHEYIDELSGALAHRILSKERRTPPKKRRVLSRVRF